MPTNTLLLQTQGPGEANQILNISRQNKNKNKIYFFQELSETGIHSQTTSGRKLNSTLSRIFLIPYRISQAPGLGATKCRY